MKADLSNSESPQFIGRVVTALAVDPDLMQKFGNCWARRVTYGWLNGDRQAGLTTLFQEGKMAYACVLHPEGLLILGESTSHPKGSLDADEGARV